MVASASIFPSLRSPDRTTSRDGSRSNSPARQPTESKAGSKAPVLPEESGTNTGMSACEMFPLWTALAASKRERCLLRRNRRAKSKGGSKRQDAAAALDDSGSDSASGDEADEARAAALISPTHGEAQGRGSIDSQATLTAAVPGTTARPGLQRIKSSLMEQQADWVQKDLGEAQEMNDAAARQFAEISLEPAIQEISVPTPPPRSPVLASPGTTSPGPGHIEPGHGIDLQLTDDQKMAAIIDEFGEVASTVVGPDGQVEPERILAHAPGIMFKGVMLVGNIHLTTHRLLVHAPLPPDEAFVRKYTSTEPGQVPAFDHPVKSTDLVHSGPVTWHRAGPLVSAQRVWLELSAEMMSTYPSADDVGRTRPLKSILLSSVRKLEPSDRERPSDFVIEYEGPTHPLVARFTVDTEQSAAAWRRDFEAAMYRLTRQRWRQLLMRNRQLENKAGFMMEDGTNGAVPELEDELDDNQWSMMRYCVPLDQVTLVATDEYYGLGQIVNLELHLKQRKALFEAEMVAQGEYHKLLKSAYAPDEDVEDTGAAAAASAGGTASQGSSNAHSHSLLHCLGPAYGSGTGSAHQPPANTASTHDGEVKRKLSFPNLVRRFSGNKDRKQGGSGSSTPSRLGPNAAPHASHAHLHSQGPPEELSRHIKNLQRDRQASRDATAAHAEELQSSIDSLHIASPSRAQEGSALASAPGSPLHTPPRSPIAGPSIPGPAISGVAGAITGTLDADAPTTSSPLSEAQPDATSSVFAFNLVLLKDWEYFIGPLREAIDYAHQRKPVPGKEQAHSSLNIAGMDVLVTDEEIEALHKARVQQRQREKERDRKKRHHHTHHLGHAKAATTAGATAEDGVRTGDDNHPDADPTHTGSESEDYAGDMIDNEDDLDMDGHQHKSLGVRGTVKHVGHAASAAAKRVRKAEKTHMMAREFGLKEEEGIWIKRSYVIHGGVPMRGHIIVTPRFLCFWRRMLMSHDIKYRFKTSDIKGIEAIAVPAHPHPFGIALHLHAQHDVQFVFWHRDARDEVVKRVQEVLDSHRAANGGDDDDGTSRLPSSAPLSPAASVDPSMQDASTRDPMSPFSTPGIGSPLASPSSSHPSSQLTTIDPYAPQKAIPGHAADILAPPRGFLFTKRTFPDDLIPVLPFVANKPWAARTSTLSPRTFACLTIGSRGDVQPYIALGVRLLKDGHKVVIITHAEFKEWVEGYGIEHRQAGGDPTVLMKFSSDHSMLSPGFFKEALGTMRQWLDDYAWNACHDVDVLIESPSAMAGVHIAEARKIPYFRAFTMPWNRTSAYPQAFMVPAFDMGPSFNYSTYTLYDNVIWTATSGQINKWRKKHLGLPATSNAQLSTAQIPYLYNFSEAVVPKPLDWSDAVNITGYWTLENSDSEWSPPEALEEFMRKAREDGKALVYIGFGSIVVSKPNQVTRSIIEAVEKADVRAIIAKGWSSRGGDPSEEGQEIEFPSSCFSLDKVPHGWLFPKIDAAMHHGGAGTTGASLGAGLPTIIKPFFGDQHFWRVPFTILLSFRPVNATWQTASPFTRSKLTGRALRVTKLGVGLKATSFRASDMATALKKVTTDTVMREKAARVGRAIRRENGVDNALEAIHFNIVRAAADRGSLRFNK